MNRRAWRMRKAGSLDWLEPVEESLGPVPADQVRVAVRAIGLNFADIFACLGLYSATPSGAFVPGLEYAGIVDDIGADVGSGTGLSRGTAVIGLTRFGAYASHVDVKPAYLTPLPDGWTFAQGAAYAVQTLTAWYAIAELGACRSDYAVLVHSAAGGVGLQALAILDAIGATSIGTVGDAGKMPFLLERTTLTPDRIIVREPRRYAEQLRAALQGIGRPGFDLILDAIAGPYFMPGYRALRPAGRLVLFGAADFMPTGRRPNWISMAYRYLTRPRIDAIGMVHRNRSVMGFNLIWLWEQASRLVPAYEALAALHLPPPHVGRCFRFDDLPSAMRFLQGGRSVGKVIVDVDS